MSREGIRSLSYCRVTRECMARGPERHVVCEPNCEEWVIRRVCIIGNRQRSGDESLVGFFRSPEVDAHGLSRDRKKSSLRDTIREGSLMGILSPDPGPICF